MGAVAPREHHPRSWSGVFFGAVGLVAPPVAVGLIVAAGFLTPGYDPMKRTISRMAVSGSPAASFAVLGTCLVGVTALALAMGLGPRFFGGRSFLAVAGGALLLAAAVRLDPGSIRATIEHDSAAAIAAVALAAAPLALARSHGRFSLVFGAAEVGVLLVGLVLLPTTF